MNRPSEPAPAPPQPEKTPLAEYIKDGKLTLTEKNYDRRFASDSYWGEPRDLSEEEKELIVAALTSQPGPSEPVPPPASVAGREDALAVLRYQMFCQLRSDSPHEELRATWDKIEKLLDVPPPETASVRALEQIVDYLDRWCETPPETDQVARGRLLRIRNVARAALKAKP